MKQTLLDANPTAPVRVYAIWFKMYPGDARERWRPTLLDDSRALQFWDNAKVMGRLFFNHLPTLAARQVSPSVAIEGDVLWDAYLLYGPDARWKDADLTKGVASWGSTILSTQDEFLRDFLSLIAGP